MIRREVIFKASYWYHEEDDNKTIIHIGGRTANNQSVHTIVKGFTPFVYIELPKRIGWNRSKMQNLFEYLQESMGSKGPISWSPHQKYRLHFKEKILAMFLTFATDDATHCLMRKCSSFRGFAVPGIGSIQPDELKVHEANIDPVLKFTAVKQIQLANWISVKESPLDEEDPSDDLTSADIDLYCDWQEVQSVEAPEGSVGLSPYFCSFDIECYSVNHNSKLPNPEITGNLIFQISMVFGTIGDLASREHILLSLGKPRESFIKGCDRLLTFESEADLLLGFVELIQTRNPDIFIGYNILKFDWGYLIARAKLLNIDDRFYKLSRLINRHADERTIKWGSSACGEQLFYYLECHGRVNVDVLIEVERNFRLPKYSLDTVSEYFLGKRKDDVSARGLFMLYRLTDEILPKMLTDNIIGKRTLTDNEVTLFRKRVVEIFPIRKCTGIVKEYRSRLLNAKAEEIPEMCKEAMEITGKYCIQDTILPIDLAEKLNLWTTMEEMSNVVHVPISYLHTRGQQIKVVSQLFRETIRKNIIIPNIKKTDSSEKYQGAVVIEAREGDYELVATLDFASMYPSVMIVYNICYTTICKDDDPIPDEECHVLIWEDHVGCEHDPQKRKKKKEDILCKAHRYRFRKIKYVFDEKTGHVTRENEGVMPRLERNLLTSRKAVKREMFKVEARLKMHLGKATETDLIYYRKMGWEIIEVGSLSEKEEKITDVMFRVLNAKQMARKIAANSAYGTMGVGNGMIPLIVGAASVTAMGRALILLAIDRVKKEYESAELVYGDTDSCMFHFRGKSMEQSFVMAEKVAKIVSRYLKCHVIGLTEDYTIGPEDRSIHNVKSDDTEYFSQLSYEERCLVLSYESCPIDLEFENMYGRFLLLTKKRYVAHSINRKGDIINTIKKGVVLVRRDNSKYLRDTYSGMTDLILDKRPEIEVMNFLYDRVNMIFTRQIPPTHLIIYMGIRSVISYAKSHKQKQGKIVTSQTPIDANNYLIEDPIGPLDPRLVYPNIPQVLLALKLLRRGEEIPPNTRLEFLYLKVPDAQHQGEKAEDYTYFYENKEDEHLKPDYQHYLEKQLTKPVTELLSVKYPKGVIPYRSHEEQFHDSLKALNDLHRCRVAKLKTYEKDRPPKTKTDGVHRCYNIDSDRLALDRTFKKYVFRQDAKENYILDQMIRFNHDPNAISKQLYPALYQLCLEMKSISVIDHLYKHFGLTRRRWRRPAFIGEKLRSNTKIVMMERFDQLKKGEIGKIIERHDLGTKGHEIYSYDLLFEKEMIVKDVPRAMFTTFTIKDGNILKDMLQYRQAFGEVIDHLNRLSCRVEFIDP